MQAVGGDTNDGGPPWSVSPPTTLAMWEIHGIVFRQLLSSILLV